MANKYAGTKTEKNLEAAFAGESQARNKYTYFASRAKKDGYEQIADLFLKTADNEKEHAKLWFKELEGIGDTAENLATATRPAFTFATNALASGVNHNAFEIAGEEKIASSTYYNIRRRGVAQNRCYLKSFLLVGIL